jgi:formylglycine-generating enzyme required for sulfatase activity
VRETGHRSDEILHFRRIDRRFAISTREVTVEQFERFLADRPEVHASHTKTEIVRELQRHSPDKTCPQINGTWYHAIAYCNWLSEREEIPPDQWCYVPNKDGRYEEGAVAADDFLGRVGYRLPTEAEWEYAARAGAETARCYGQSPKLLRHYAHYDENAQDQAWPVGSLMPNDFGLFDVYGNVSEWCQNAHRSFSRSGTITLDVVQPTPPAVGKDRILRGGSFYNHEKYVRSARRLRSGPSNRSPHYGFRVARTQPTSRTAASDLKTGADPAVP